MDQAHADVEAGDGLYTLGLAVCIGITIIGEYNTHPEQGEIRHDKLLAYLADGPIMEVTFNTLELQVESAKRHGLKSLRVKMSVVNPESLRGDEFMFVWSESDIRQTKDTNALYACKVRESTRATSGPATLMYIEGHHVNGATDTEILASKEIRTMV